MCIRDSNTILDGNQTGTVLKLSASTVAAEFVVEGLTLRKGTSSGLSAVVGPGGEVLVDNNSISGNTSESPYPSFGGGVYLSAPTATLTNNDISGNTASSGGGGVYLSAATATLTNNAISGNSASSGGGVYLSVTTATLTNNDISGNAFGWGGDGGGVYLSATTATLTNNDISGNTFVSNPSVDFSRGGGVYLSVTTATLTNNDISGNTVYYGGDGGGLYVVFPGSEPQSSVALFNNLFWLNHATGYQGADFHICLLYTSLAG